MGSDGSWGSIEGKELGVGACKWAVRCEWACVGGVMACMRLTISSRFLANSITKNGLLTISEKG